MQKMKETTVAIAPDFIMSFVVKNSFPFLSCNDVQHKLGNDETGMIWEAVVAAIAPSAYNLRCGVVLANLQMIGRTIVAETVCEMKTLINNSKKEMMKNVTHVDVFPSNFWSKSETIWSNPDSLTTYPRALPPITRNKMFHGSLTM